MTRRVLGQFKKTLATLLPPVLFCRIEDIIRPALDPRFRGSPQRAITVDRGVLCVSWPSGEKFYFPHPERYVRYMRAEGLRYIFDEMLRKYQDGNIRVRPGDTVIEAGANVGEFTCAVAPIAAQVYAFEPDPYVLRSLRANTSHLQNVSVEPVALGESDGGLDLFISTGDADSSVFQPGKWSEQIRVPVTTVDDFVRERQLQRIDFLKIEAEGFEPEVLRGCSAILRSVRHIAVDCSPERNGETTFDECERILWSAGFKTRRRCDNYHVLLGCNENHPDAA